MTRQQFTKIITRNDLNLIDYKRTVEFCLSYVNLLGNCEKFT